MRTRRPPAPSRRWVLRRSGCRMAKSSFPKPTQRLLHVRTIIATRQATRQSRVLIGTVVPDPSSFGQVQAPMEGRIELTERGISNVGQRVEAGEVLAYLAPSIPIADLGTMQQLTAEVAGKLKIAEQKLARLERIAGVVAQKDIDDTRAELDALREQQRVLVLEGHRAAFRSRRRSAASSRSPTSAPARS